MATKAPRVERKGTMKLRLWYRFANFGLDTIPKLDTK
jgi:hypothetical protein